MAAFGVLPLANWIPGGRVWPDAAGTWAQWLLGTGICIAAGAVLFILFRDRPRYWPGPFLARSARAITERRGWELCLGLLACATYAAIAWWTFGARPRLIDEIVQVWQGRMLAGGHLFLPPAAHPEFFAVSQIVDWQGKLYGQFPVGGPALFALGTLAHAEWLVDPVLGGLGVIFFARLLRRIDPDPAIVVWGSVLFAASPFWAFQAGSFMNHVPTVTLLLGGTLALAAVTTGEGGVRSAALAGLAFAAAGAVRPVDGLAFALPACLWLAWRALRHPARRAEFAALIGGASIPAALVAWVNWRTTGSPFLFGYTVAWGADHGLGFHPTPWGPRHTPLGGVELLNLYFVRLQEALFESPLPGLLPAAAALDLAPRLSSFERFLLGAGACLTIGYWAYWHDGNFLGPRFVLPLVPLLVLWTARFPALLPRAALPPSAERLALCTLIAAIALSLTLGIPARARAYGREFVTARWDADAAADQAGVRGSLILVRESWGAQLVVRLWALGVPRARTEAIYHRVDACRLETAIDSLEAHAIHGDAAVQALEPLEADSTRLVPSRWSADSSEQLLPDSYYGPRCVERLQEDRAGFTVHAPLILAGRGRDNVYARDLHGRDSLLLQDFPGRPLWLLTADPAPGARPRYLRLDPDSLRRAWRSGP